MELFRYAAGGYMPVEVLLDFGCSSSLFKEGDLREYITI